MTVRTMLSPPALFAAAAFALTPVAASAQDEPEVEEAFEFPTEEEEAMATLEREMDESFAIFGEIFKAEPLTAEQEALMPLASEMVDKIMPVGTFGIAMQDSMEPMMAAMMGAVSGNPRLRISSITGVDADELEALDDDQAQEVLDIFDPAFEARTNKMSEILIEMVGGLFNAIEPAYRDAYARALTTKFGADEMTELLAFFEKPVGEKFAQQSFLVQYDPQMLGVMEQMGPAMMEVMPGMMESFKTLDEQLAEARSFGDLSANERARAARLIGKGEAELDALQPPEEEVVEEDAGDFF
ncbi:DUF2059 domain-containing protein [Erythrobacter sp. MTPC3]|uniref:DUF2059 domain-containing protein n=1 Tax=Erythrobacter sp. MTPC3 TaxID=3056564 RepID=UPI0036F3D6E7